MSRFSLSIKFGLLFLGFILAIGLLVGLFVEAGSRVGVNLFDLKDRAFPEYEELAAARDSFKDFTAMIEEVVSTGEGDLLESASKSGKILVAHLDGYDPSSEQRRLPGWQHAQSGDVAGPARLDGSCGCRP